MVELLFSVSIAILGGLLMSRPIKALQLPAVTGYIITGILLGPFCLGALGVSGLGFTSAAQVSSLSVISETATGFIAFSMGNEFRLSQLKYIGKKATVVGIMQALVTTALVDVCLIILHFIIPDIVTLPVALTLGAIAAATAPASTMMVINQYKAKGPLTDLLLPVVAIDDAVGLVLFAVSFGIAQSLGSGTVDVISVVAEPIIEVTFSLALGFAMGMLFNLTERMFHSRSKRMSISIAFVLFTVAVSKLQFTVGGVHIGFSTLLACMMLGSVFCNVCDVSEELMERTERWTAPLYILFFVLSGASLDFSVFTSMAIVGVGVAFILSRMVGKYIGARSSAAWVHCDPQVTKYLGITLFPQEGVALGMSITALSLGEEGVLIRNILLFAVLVYELTGPLSTKIALTRAGEIKPGAKNSRGVMTRPQE